jgi:hypothetical protein
LQIQLVYILFFLAKPNNCNLEGAIMVRHNSILLLPIELAYLFQTFMAIFLHSLLWIFFYYFVIKNPTDFVFFFTVCHFFLLFFAFFYDLNIITIQSLIQTTKIRLLMITILIIIQTTILIMMINVFASFLNILDKFSLFFFLFCQKLY